MELTRIAGPGDCGGEDCPTIYRTDQGTLVVQGYAVPENEHRVPAGEGAVEIPMELLMEAVGALGG